MKIKKLLPVLLLIGGVFCYFLFSRSPDEAKSYLQIPIRFSPLTCAPLMKVEIEGKKYSLLIDLGSSHPIDLEKKALRKIQYKEPLGTFQYFDMKGNSYPIPAFKVPAVKINENVKIKEISIHEENFDFLTKGSKGYAVRGFWNKILNRVADQLDLLWIDGRIGWTAFKSLNNWFFDFPRARVFGARDLSTLMKEAAVSIEDFVQVPFSLEKWGIVLSAETDFGKKKFLLDTGATRSVYKDSIDRRHKMRLVLGEHDFGIWEFRSFPLADNLEIDGVLGADFFRNHAICLDFSNQVLYIQPVAIL